MTEYYFDTSASAAIAQIKSSLEEIAHDTETFHHSGDNNLIARSIQSLDDISGTLTFLSFFGGVEICRQMKESFEYVITLPITDSGKIIEILIAATFFLDKYIDFAFSNRSDNKLLVLDMVNLLKDCCDKKPVTEFEFAFSSLEKRMDWPTKKNAPKKISQKSQLLLKKLQHVYQVGLLGAIKNNSEQHIKLMIKAISKTYKMMQQYACGEYWLLARCFLDVIYKKQIEIDNSVKALLASINLEFSYLKKYDYARLDAKTDEKKIFGLYYYLMKSGTTTTSIKRICSRYTPSASIFSAEKTAADKSALDAPDSSVLDKVSNEIEEQLDIVRDKLLTLYSDKDLNDDVLAQLREDLFNINSTLSLLGLDDAASAIHDIDDDLCAIISGSVDNFESTIASAADSIEAADAMIKGFGDPKAQTGTAQQPKNSYFDEALDILIKESRSNMSKVKSEMEEYVDSCMDRSQISRVPLLLGEIHGALSILEFDKAANIISSCNSYITSKIIESDTTPKTSDLDSLTDSLAGIEWYLEGFDEFRQTNDGLLDVASRSLEQLGALNDFGASSESGVGAAHHP
ncbi:MAG: hypothetical protein D6B28_08895 [Gammaproteobacteria bacterium]|nr:MAG: hypothetical protein D6B28_08895 [Gammaproteobacteria bacterium]